MVGAAAAVVTVFGPAGVRLLVCAAWFAAINLWVVRDVSVYGVQTPATAGKCCSPPCSRLEPAEAP